MTSKRLRRLRWALVPVALILLSVIWLRSRVPTPGSSTAAVLEAAADQWWHPGVGSRTINEDEWPPELRKLGPESVRVSNTGVYIQFGSFMVSEWGLFIPPSRSDFQPTPGSDPSFRHLRGRVYQYDIAG